MSDYNSILFGSLAELEESSNSFVFLLNSGEEVFYAVCVHHREFTDTLPGFALPKCKGKVC